MIMGLLLLAISMPVAFCGSHERRLLNDLSLNYNKLERPVAEESDALEIKFGLTLQ